MRQGCPYENTSVVDAANCGSGIIFIEVRNLLFPKYLLKNAPNLTVRNVIVYSPRQNHRNV